MKVVLFCGGLGMRIREAGESTPKPMVLVGERPILWHVMKYYAHFGHKDFILCLGYRADVIKNYFINYSEFISNDFVWRNGGKEMKVFNSDIDDWTITFADTGPSANIGERLKAVEKYLDKDEMFLANYSDNLTDFHLPDIVSAAQKERKIGAFLCVPPNLSCHAVSVDERGLVQGIKNMGRSELVINGGYFVFNRAIFDYIRPGEELVQEPFQRLIAEKQLLGYMYDGFWKSMDTFKEKQELDDLYRKGCAPWQLWRGQDGTQEYAASGNGIMAIPVAGPKR
ncbi:MAG TPA: sugar phosphate nucleotidyltransferase [Acidobacteriaceae bacterium]|jgi:glucose-1-phosphate cytidylyltransferase|nr:sugar phosphate nucleotidyltransferase [Acidobacteriaceae bacterium]